MKPEQCPKCGGPVDEGYGLAGGGGLGSFRYCAADTDCDFFEKDPDRQTVADSQGWAGERP